MEFSFYIWISFEMYLNYIWRSRSLCSFGFFAFAFAFAFCFRSLSATFDFTFGRVMILSIFCFCFRLLLSFCWQSLFLLWYWREYSKTVIFIVDFQIDWRNWTGTCSFILFFILFFFWVNRCKDLFHDLFVFVFCFCLR